MIRKLENELELRQGKAYFEDSLYTGICYFPSGSNQWTAKAFHQGIEKNQMPPGTFSLLLKYTAYITSGEELVRTGIKLDIDDGNLIEEAYFFDGQKIGHLSFFGTGQPEMLEIDHDGLCVEAEWTEIGRLMECDVSMHPDYRFRATWNDAGKLKTLSFDGSWQKFIEDKQNPFSHSFNDISFEADERLFLSGDALTDDFVDRWLTHTQGIKQLDLYDTQLSVPFIQAWLKNTPPNAMYVKDDRNSFKQALEIFKSSMIEITLER